MKFNIGNLLKITNRISITFSVFVLTLSVLASVVGSEAHTISSLFRLGSDGISLATIGEVFLISCVIALEVHFLDRLNNRKSFTYQATINFSMVLITTVFFILIYDWFPYTNILSWITFILSCLLFFFMSATIMLIKTKKENEEIQKLFNTYQQSKEKKG